MTVSTKPPLLDPMIFKMKTAAEEMISEGDDYGHLALFWINRWIETPSIHLDEDALERGERVDVATAATPANFPWRFNNSSELGEYTSGDTPSRKRSYVLEADYDRRS